MIELVTKTKVEVGLLWILEDIRIEEAFISLNEVRIILGEVVHHDILLVDFILQQ